MFILILYLDLNIVYYTVVNIMCSWLAKIDGMFFFNKLS